MKHENKNKNNRRKKKQPKMKAMRLPRHFGRAERMAHEQYCLGSAIANLTCRNCGELFVHIQARRLHERFCANVGQRRKVLFIGYEIAGLKLGYLTPFLAGQADCST